MIGFVCISYIFCSSIVYVFDVTLFKSEALLLFELCVPLLSSIYWFRLFGRLAGMGLHPIVHTGHGSWGGLWHMLPTLFFCFLFCIFCLFFAFLTIMVTKLTAITSSTIYWKHRKTYFNTETNKQCVRLTHYWIKHLNEFYIAYFSRKVILPIFQKIKKNQIQKKKNRWQIKATNIGRQMNGF